MRYGREFLKRRARAFFSRATVGRTDVPILRGPLRGMRLPRKVACGNLCMVINGYEPYVISEIVSARGSIQNAYDVGAHLGLLTLALCKRVKPGGKVVAFEPLPDNCRGIEELIHVNQLFAAIIAMELALSDRDGEQILLKGETPFLNLLEGSAEKLPSRPLAGIPVRVARVDTLVFQGKIPPPGLIKLDVEGEEFRVLKGARRTLEAYRPEILIEIHGPENGDQVWDLLEPLRYAWFHVSPSGKRPISEKREVLSLFSEKTWTRHFLLIHEPSRSALLQQAASAL